MNTTTLLPISRATMYLQSDGTYSETSTGAPGESAVTVPVTDLVLMDDLDPGGAETTSDLQAYTQDCYHVLLEALGSNAADPTGGVGVENALSAPDTVMSTIGTVIDRQIELDPRTQSCSTVSVQTAEGQWQTTITILPVSSIEPVQFTYSRLAGLQLVRT
jgi:hypothetical protein